MSEKQFRQCVLLMDSDQSNEAVAAFNKAYALSKAAGKHWFGELIRKSENAITPEQAQALATEIANWEREHAARVAENETLEKRNKALTAVIISLRSALWFSGNLRKIVTASVAIIILFGGYRYWTGQAPPDPQSIVAKTDDPKDAALDDALSNWLHRVAWRAGFTTPVIVHLRDGDFWATIRGFEDKATHTDAQGGAVNRHCSVLYADAAVRDGGSFLTPEPRSFFSIKWPARAVLCRGPGTPGYEP